MSDATDAELCALIDGGGERARAAELTLCRRYAPRIRLYGLRHLRSEERARDLVQTVLVAVLEALRAGRVEDRHKLDRFVLGTCRNTALRMHHTEARSVPLSDELSAALEAHTEQSVELPALMHCFDKLEPKAKKVLLLSFQEERPAEEIATLLALQAGNVRVVRHRALSALRRCLEAGEGASV